METRAALACLGSWDGRGLAPGRADDLDQRSLALRKPRVRAGECLARASERGVVGKCLDRAQRDDLSRAPLESMLVLVLVLGV